MGDLHHLLIRRLGPLMFSIFSLLRKRNFQSRQSWRGNPKVNNPRYFKYLDTLTVAHFLGFALSDIL